MFSFPQSIRCLAAAAVTFLCAPALFAADLFVAPGGNDAGDGARDRPFATLARAQHAAREASARGEAVNVFLRGGTHYLAAPLVFTSVDSGRAGAPVVYRAYENETPVVSGGTRLDLQWRPFRDGIWQATVPDGLQTDQLFVNGEQQNMARYPNFDASVLQFNGYAADAFSPERAKRWADPKGGYIHAMHDSLWGGFSYRITGKNAKGEITYEGGWLNNRQSGMHPKYRMVENIFEELDAPGEWFHDAKTRTLYFYPPAGVDLKTALVEAVRLRTLVEFRGDEKRPVRFVTLRGLTFRHAVRTFMDNREPLLRSDWTIYRGGAIFFNGAENCELDDCLLDQVGGSAVFVNNYNRRLAIRACHIVKAGENGVAFVGDPKAVRNALFEYEQRQSFSQIDKTPGPLTNNYPADCLVEDCLIHETGRVGKQSAPVEIDMAARITVRHCSIYDVPRAGINIGDGCWGGHVIEGCDMFNTVLETGDHGSFNAWGRDRFWGLKGVDPNTVTLGVNKNLPVLDAVETTILRNSRWRCDHGWDIDLDDGSTNYLIENNLCLSGGLKNREGYDRTVQNNVIVNNSFHPHVWFENSQDIFRRNIVFSPYRPVGLKTPWGKEMDDNLLQQKIAVPRPAAELQKQSGRDEHSLAGDAMFVDPTRGDYRVREGSPALKLGFVNFRMDDFGVRTPKLKALAKTPSLPSGGQNAHEDKSPRDTKPLAWLGAKIKNVVGLGEVSAAGLPGEVGVRLEEVPAESPAAKAGLRAGDVVLKMNGHDTPSLTEFFQFWRSASGVVDLGIWRDQKAQALKVSAPVTLPGVKAVSEGSDDGAFKTMPKPGRNNLTAGKVFTASTTTNNGPLATLTDGQLAQNYGPVFGNGVADGVYKIDLGALKTIAQVNSYSYNQNGNRGPQKFALYGSAANADPGFNPENSAQWTLIALVDTTGGKAGNFVGSSVKGQGILGPYRWLAWAVSPLNDTGENTAYQEFEVVAAP